MSQIDLGDREDKVRREKVFDFPVVSVAASRGHLLSQDDRKCQTGLNEDTIVVLENGKRNVPKAIGRAPIVSEKAFGTMAAGDAEMIR